MKFKSDIDIDFGDRTQILKAIKHTPASILRDGTLIQHNTGVYVTPIPVDPEKGIASIDHEAADERGYIKLDLLNVNLYQSVRDEAHLTALMQTEPVWDLFNTEQAFFEELIHVKGHWNLLKRMPEPVDSIPRLAMFLSVIRPAKRHLAGKTWAEVATEVWKKPDDNSYYFKKSHAIAYANLVLVNMNLLAELAHKGD